MLGVEAIWLIEGDKYWQVASEGNELAPSLSVWAAFD